MTAPVLTTNRRDTELTNDTGAPRAPHLRLVRRETAAEAQRRAIVRTLAATAVVVAALCIFGVVAAHVLLTQNQFRLDQLQEQAAEREAGYDRLRLQVAELESPDRVVAAASERLGMVTPLAITYLAPSIEDSWAETRATAAAPTATSWSTVKPHLADS